MATLDSNHASVKDSSMAGPPSSKVPLRILLADDHQMILEGLRAILEQHGFKVVAQASDGQEAVGRTMELQPDVAVLDLSMPLKNGIEAAKEIITAVPETRTILLTVHKADFYVRQALQAGIQGYVLKSRSSADLVEAIYEVCQGLIYLSPGISPEVVRDHLGKPSVSAAHSEVAKP